MKYLYTTSLFFFAFVVWLTSCSKSDDQPTPESKHPKLLQLFRASGKDTLSYKSRMIYIDSFLIFSKKKNNDSLIYKGIQRKTYLHGKLKELDSAIYHTEKMKERAIRQRDTIMIIKSESKLSLYHNRMGAYNSAIKDAKRMLQLAKVINNNLQIIDANKKLGRNYREMNQPNKAFVHFNQAFKILRERGDTIQAGKILHSMSKIQSSMGDHNGSRITALDGVRFLENSEELKDLAGLYHTISIAYRAQMKDSLALEYNRKARELALDPMSKKRVGISNLLVFENSRANILADQKKYPRAISTLVTLLEDPIITKNKKEKARVLSNLGYIKWLEDQKNLESESILLKAHQIRIEISDYKGLIASNVHLTKYYQALDGGLSLNYASQAYENAKKRDNDLSMLEAMRFIFTLSDTLEIPINPKLVLEYSKLESSIREINNANQEIYEPTKYENQKLVTQNLKKELKIEQEQAQRNTWIAITVIILSGGIFFIAFLLQRHKQRLKIKAVEAAYEAETNMSKRVHDELANDVSGIMSFVNHSANISEEDRNPLLDNLEDLYLRTRDISTETASINMESFDESLRNLLLQYTAPEVKLVISGLENMDWKEVPDYKKIAVYRCLQELMVNMKKHSRTNQGTVVFKAEQKNYRIQYTDNGIGANKNSIKLNGLQNVETRMKNIGGGFNFETSEGNGFKAILTFSG